MNADTAYTVNLIQTLLPLVGDFVVSETRFDGTTVQYGYDSDGNQTAVFLPDESMSFSYDGDGLMLSASNSVGVVSNEYDAATGWLASSRGADGTEVSYSRRSGGGVASATSVAGTTSYSFDAAGRRTHVASPSGSFALGYCEWNGKLSAVTNAGGFVVEYEYDVMDRATNISWKTTSGATLGGFAYEYDAVGRIVSRGHAVGSNAFDRVYAYDDLDRLASDGGVAYTYDAAGNRMTRTENGATVTYALGVGDRLASWTGGSYTYDLAGNVTRIERTGRPTLDLAWNSQYQLVSVATNGVFAEDYEYDALGRRVSTTTMEGTTRHVYDDRWQVIADLDEDGNVIASYTWGDGIDHLIAVKVGGMSYYPLTDIQGTIWGYVDSQNNVVARWRYDAWGNVIDEFVTVPALASLRYRFQGREWSAATGLVNFRMRWYDAETGRWLSKDPIGLNGGLNLYAFCKCNPVGFYDSNGTAYQVVGVLLLGAGTGAVFAWLLGGDDVAILSSALGGGVGALAGLATKNIVVAGTTATLISSSLIEYSKGECGSFRRVVTQTITATTLSYFGASFTISYGEAWLFGAYSGSVPAIINRISDLLESTWNSVFGE